MANRAHVSEPGVVLCSPLNMGNISIPHLRGLRIIVCESWYDTNVYRLSQRLTDFWMEHGVCKARSWLLLTREAFVEGKIIVIGEIMSSLVTIEADLVLFLKWVLWGRLPGGSLYTIPTVQRKHMQSRLPLLLESNVFKQSYFIIPFPSLFYFIIR